MPLYVKKLDPKATLPTCNNPGKDLAYDLFALEDTVVSGPVTKVRTGVAMQYQNALGDLSTGFLLRDRSSMAAKGMWVIGGVVDAGYTGEIIIMFSRHFANSAYEMKAGDKIAQAIPVPVMTIYTPQVVDELRGERGDKGFGSSGR